jgi:hypothetical protein
MLMGAKKGAVQYPVSSAARTGHIPAQETTQQQQQQQQGAQGGCCQHSLLTHLLLDSLRWQGAFMAMTCGRPGTSGMHGRCLTLHSHAA